MYLTKNCTDDVDCVIEIGPGPALFLISIISPTVLNADYYGLEITQTARLCVNILSSLEPNLKLKSKLFDYQYLDFGELTIRYMLMVQLGIIGKKFNSG